MNEYGINLLQSALRLQGEPEGVKWGVIILAVAHKEFMTIDLKEHKEKGCIIYDVKGIIDAAIINLQTNRRSTELKSNGNKIRISVGHRKEWPQLPVKEK